MRDKTDSALGARVHQHLQKLGLETLVEMPRSGSAGEALREGISNFLMHVGLDVEDPSLVETPKRVASMFVDELCYGLDYNNFPKCTTTPNGKPTYDKEAYDAYIEDRIRGWDGKKTREEIEASESTKAWIERNTTRLGSVNEMVMVRSINTITLCEHHFQTIHGVTHIAYIPGTKLLGLSKFARVTDFFARRPQVQERMVEQIYASLALILETDNIAIQQTCAHNCMRARGVMDPNSDTVTSKMGGVFMDNQSLRMEFLNAIPR